MIDWLSIPLQFQVMQQAALMAALIAVPAGLLSCFVVLKGWSLMGDAISHAVLPGLVLAWALGLPMLLGAMVAGMACGMVAGYVQDHSRVKPDTVLGVVMAGMFALGLVLHTRLETGLHLDHILFGSILGVDRADLTLSGVVAVVITGAVLMLRRDLSLYVFDPVQARILGLPMGLFHYGMMAAIVALVVSMLSAVGLVMAVAMLIAPGATAFLLVRRMGPMLAVSVAVALIAGQGGLIASFWLDAATAPTIVLVLTAQFVAAWAWRQTRAKLDLSGPPA
ncbi:MAG: metal ABC transporter permease [Paracoccus sp. (in: a-proteobacteria)]|nr:metal ABC transporter permease [Paracoccus sp. (in: a-proteobacteria)]